jgi:hypothetical protein
MRVIATCAEILPWTPAGACTLTPTCTQNKRAGDFSTPLFCVCLGCRDLAVRLVLGLPGHDVKLRRPLGLALGGAPMSTSYVGLRRWCKRMS